MKEANPSKTIIVTNKRHKVFIRRMQQDKRHTPHINVSNCKTFVSTSSIIGKWEILAFGKFAHSTLKG